MINSTGLHRILYIGNGLVIVVILILGLIVIPSVIRDTSPQAAPETAVPGILLVIFIHLVIVAAMIRTIIDIRRGGRVSKGLHIGLGVLLLLMTLMVLDGASAYVGHSNPIMHRAAISMFVGTLFDFIASLLNFLIAWYSKRFQSS